MRAALPGVAVRSTFIAGFPGETDEEFDELLAFVREAGLAAAGVFPFDAQEGTPAATLPGQVPAALAFERAAQLGEVIDDVAAALLAGARRASRSRCSSSAARDAPDGVAVGRCALQAPDIDGRTFVRGAGVRRGAARARRAVGRVGYDVEAVAGRREP